MTDRERIHREIQALQTMPVGELQEKWAEVWGERCRSRNRVYLIKRIAWKIQANVYGGLSQRALERARELADESFLKIRGVSSPEPIPSPWPDPSTKRPKRDSRLPSVGAEISRTYNGRKISVRVLERGFEWEGRSYRSLSAVAKAATGSHWNGFLFFGIGRKEAA